MGIRFQCHHCDFELHVKDFQAGRRGRCPECQGRFRIPQQTTAYSLAIDDQDQDVATTANVTATSTTATSVAKAKTSEPVGKPATVEQAPSRLGSPRAKKPAGTKQPTSEQPTAEKPTRESAIAPSPVAAPTQLPQALAEAVDGVWYLRPTSGGQFGPAPTESFAQWLREGRITADALVWRDGWPEWLSGLQAFPDYFQATMPTRSVAPVAQTPVAHVAETLPPLTDGGYVAAATPSLSERNRLGRKQQKRRRYMIMLSILTVLFICLITTLVVVIMMQNSAS